jgi:hypothetical protein
VSKPGELSIWSYPDFVAVNDRLQTLCARESAICETLMTTGRRMDKETLLRKGVDPRDGRSVAGPIVPKVITDAARRLLGDWAPAPSPDPVAPSGPMVVYDDPRVSRLHALCKELAGVREAIGLLRPIWARAKADASRRLCESLRPDYAEIAGRVCSALIELGNAKLAHDDWMQRHVESDMAYLRPIDTDFDRLGSPRDSSDGFRRCLSWAAEAGHFNLANLPATWRKAAEPIVSAKPTQSSKAMARPHASVAETVESAPSTVTPTATVRRAISAALRR